MFLIFTDLDGTLLDHNTYSWEPARDMIRLLRETATPWIFTTSKTRAEVLWWREQMGNTHPFIVENGGAAFFPAGGIQPAEDQGIELEGFRVLEWGTRYPKLLEALRVASRGSDCPVLGFSQMTVEEVAGTCGLPEGQALLAKRREYDEPFQVLREGCDESLVREIEQQGLRWTRGGRFWHICGDSDKARAVEAVTQIYRREQGSITTIGLGDSFNDLPFLAKTDIAVVIRSKHSTQLMKQLPGARLTPQSGPAGWAQALRSILP
ncbi:MAG: HAD-IIB family hydrolase [Acidimicrobiia bacterium]|nr:HAD-IIB family hydrolase [Acidimicrobiia bacterium]